MTALVAFQLALTTSGMPCVMPGTGMPAGSMRAQAVGDGAQMAMSAMVSGSPTGRVGAGSANMPGRAPCDQQMRWPVCQTMGPCITALAPAETGGCALPHHVPARIAALVIIAPPSRTYPPDLPPPRA